MGELYVVVVDGADKAKKVVKKIRRNNYGVIRYIAIAVEVKDPRALGGFASQYNAKIIKSLIITS